MQLAFTATHHNSLAYSSMITAVQYSTLCMCDNGCACSDTRNTCCAPSLPPFLPPPPLTSCTVASVCGAGCCCCCARTTYTARACKDDAEKFCEGSSDSSSAGSVSRCLRWVVREGHTHTYCVLLLLPGWQQQSVFLCVCRALLIAAAVHSSKCYSSRSSNLSRLQLTHTLTCGCCVVCAVLLCVCAALLCVCMYVSVYVCVAWG